jgi:Cytochrome c oxidase caa3 assembly factor (Caa3_CtaG)
MRGTILHPSVKSLAFVAGKGPSGMAWQQPTIIPYCGPPPSPGSLWLSWNLDPVLIGGLVAVLGLYVLGDLRLQRAGRGLGARQRAAFHSGWLITALALVSPLCALSVSLFAARVGQHMILTLLAAPLVAAGRPVQVIAAALDDPMSRGRWGNPRHCSRLRFSHCCCGSGTRRGLMR